MPFLYLFYEFEITLKNRTKKDRKEIESLPPRIPGPEEGSARQRGVSRGTFRADVTVPRGPECEQRDPDTPAGGQWCLGRMWSEEEGKSKLVEGSPHGDPSPLDLKF